jgi:hypothetical protein
MAAASSETRIPAPAPVDENELAPQTLAEYLSLQQKPWQSISIIAMCFQRSIEMNERQNERCFRWLLSAGHTRPERPRGLAATKAMGIHKMKCWNQKYQTSSLVSFGRIMKLEGMIEVISRPSSSHSRRRVFTSADFLHISAWPR